MRIDRAALFFIAVLTLAGATPAQRGPADGNAAVRIEHVTPSSLTVATSPADIAVAGKGFAAKAVVRIRRAGDHGNGVDLAAEVSGSTSLRARVPVELLDRAGSLELRVRNPDGTSSDWATLDVKAATSGGGNGGGEIGARKPVVERVSPERLEALSHGLHIAV